jgi:hypothetical protein
MNGRSFFSCGKAPILKPLAGFEARLEPSFENKGEGDFVFQIERVSYVLR